jgi:hypothetical protein
MCEKPEYKIPLETRMEMIQRLLWAWDGQWFLKVYEEFGWETATRINSYVRVSFGRAEMLTLLRALGKTRAKDLEDAGKIFQAYASQILGKGFSGRGLMEDGRLNIFITRCAALEGARLTNLERNDQACIACEGLWPAWFRTLLRGNDVHMEIKERMGDGAECCHFVMEVDQADEDQR